MCICFYALKGLRDSATPDALWAFDPGRGTTSSSRWAQHAVGPAPSMKSCVAYKDVSGKLGALFDSDGYLSAQFSLSNMDTQQTPAGAWNGTDTAWFLGAQNGGFVSWFAYDLSGNQLTSARYDSGSRFRAACNSSGDLIAYNTGLWPNNPAMQRRTRSGSVAASSTAVSDGPLCVDASDNILIGVTTSLKKYNDSFTQQWSVSLSEYVTAVVADTSSNPYALLTQVPSGATVKIQKFNSSGTSQWVVTTGMNGLYDPLVDYWSDGTNVFLAYEKKVGFGTLGMTVEKYNGSGTLQWSRVVWYEDGNTRLIKSIRTDGSLMALAGIRGQ